MIFITARVHPGETASSWVMEGLIKFLVYCDVNGSYEDSSSSDGKSTIRQYTEEEIKTAQYLRKRFTFVLIPMVNPDGVIVGNYCSSFAGHDLNKVFLVPNKKLHPSIFNIKELI